MAVDYVERLTFEDEEGQLQEYNIHDARMNKLRITKKVSKLDNDAGYLIDKDYIHTDNNYTTIEKQIVATVKDKVDKVEGKGLSTNDLTDELLNELIKIQENKVDKVEGKGLSTNDFTNEDKEKLDSIIADPNNITIDAALSETSENPVQNKVITSKLNEVFQSVSDGKSKIAAAITDKGISTAADATFNTMANNISKIETGSSTQKDNMKILCNKGILATIECIVEVTKNVD